jgi:hypothetical protein
MSQARHGLASNVTSKSPLTTGAGLEGAMIKAPFNALTQIIDLNNAFPSFAVSGSQGFTLFPISFLKF